MWNEVRQLKFKYVSTDEINSKIGFGDLMTSKSIPGIGENQFNQGNAIKSNGNVVFP